MKEKWLNCTLVAEDKKWIKPEILKNQGKLRKKQDFLRGTKYSEANKHRRNGSNNNFNMMKMLCGFVTVCIV